MLIQEVGHFDGVFTTSSTMSVVVPKAGCAAGNMLIIRVSAQSGVTFAASDSRGNPGFVDVYRNGSARAQAILRLELTQALVEGDTITVTMSAEASRQHMVVEEFDDEVLSVDGQVTAAGESTTPSAELTPSGAARLFIGAVLIRADTDKGFTQDGDSAGGPWKALNPAGAAGAGATGDQLRGAYKLATNAEKQIYNPTLAEVGVWEELLVAYLIAEQRLPIQASPPPPVSVVSIAAGGADQGYDLTDDLEGLSWSSVNPGGDERCTFTLKRSWFSDTPEIARGNLLRVMCGIDVLWQGRVEETDRSADSAEAIAVTAYGLGARLKDGTFQEIFIDRDLSAWSDPSVQRQINMLALGRRYEATPNTAAQDAGAAGPGIIFAFSRYDGSTEIGEAWYFGGGVDLGEIRCEVRRLTGAADSQFASRIYVVTDDIAGSYDPSTDYDKGNTANASVTATVAGRKYGQVEVINENPLTGDVKEQLGFLYVRVFGRHKLSPQGSQPNEGFTVDQMVNYIIGLAPGVTVRQLDHQSYVVQQAAFKEPVAHEDGIVELNKLEGCDWGTWGPDSPLDNSTDGQFDFKTRDSSTQHWSIHREDCEPIDLHSETSTLYGAVDVSYEDVAGVRRTIRRTVDVPDLDGAELSRVYPLDIGKSKLEVAEQMGDAFLAIWGQFAPARGSFTTSLPVRHYRRGELPPVYMRADGSNVRIGDILPSSDALALDSTPDRRTTFPIKRVEVDCSGEVPSARVEVDQANDTLSILQARESAASGLVA